MSKQYQYLSDFVTLNEVQDWRQGEVILINAPTGRGKSHFVKTVLREHLKSKDMTCLYLLSRDKTLQQFRQELPDDEVIHFQTYQSLETLLLNPETPYKKYSVIVADEGHYFLDDANFNRNTDLSIEWILGQTDSIRVFMSATHEFLMEYLNELRIMYFQYSLPNDYSKIISLNFFWRENQLPILADRVLSSNERAIFFIQSAAAAHSLYEKYKDRGMFLCSSHNKKFSRYMDDELVSKLLEDEQFDCNLLFTTAALDTGVTLKDKTLTHIVVDITEPVKIVQCLGRKRFTDESDNVRVYIRGRTNQQVSGLVRACQDGLNEISEFQTNGAVAYNAKYGRSNSTSGLIYDGVLDSDGEPAFNKRVNSLKYAKLRYDKKVYQQMLDMGEYGYVRYIAKLLGKGKYGVMEEVEAIKNLEQYLKSIASVPMYTPQDREELIRQMDIRHNRHLCRNFETLSVWLKNTKLPFRLESFRKTVMIDGMRKDFRNVWIVLALEG